jgi:replicative DNA helicase
MDQTDTLPPHNEIAEWFLVACSLEKPDILPGILPESFYCEAPRQVLHRAQQLHAESVADLQIVLLMEQARQDGNLYTRTQAALNDLPSAEQWPVYKQEVEALADQRAGLALAADCARLARAGKLDPVALAERAKTLTCRRAETFNAEAETLAAAEQMQRAYDDPAADAGILSGLPGLDRITNGWKPGELVIVGARPSTGKTTFALNQTAEAVLRQNAQAIFYSLEMPTPQVMRHLLSAEARIDRDAFRRQQLHPADFDRLARAVAAFRRAKLTVRDNARDVEGIAADLAQHAQGLHRPALVVVDYLQIVESRAAASEKRYAQVGAVSRALKLLAMQFRLPVIALAQLSRELDRTDREPVLADLRESGSIEQDADAVAFLHPTEARAGYKPTPTKLIVAKNRNGPLGSVLLAFHQSQGRFYQAALSE